MRKIFLALTLFTGLCSVNTYAQIIGTGTYIPGNYVGVGMDNAGGFEGLTLASSAPTPSTVHPRGITGYFGFTANPQMDGWVNFDGDFFTPGTPENGWGLELGSASGTKLSNNRYVAPGDVAIPTTGAPVFNYAAGCYTADWDGSYVGSGYNIDVHVQYHLKEDDLYYTTTVWITNNGSATIPEVYYYRNVDPDNNQTISGSYTTTNTIVYQPTPTCSKALVSATQSSPWTSYMGFAAMGADYRVSKGGFSNRDGSDIWNGTGGLTGTMGSVSTADEGISLAHRTLNLDPGETTVIKFLVILDAAQVEQALLSYMEYVYLGAVADPPSCIANIDTATSCSGNPITISYDGTLVNDFSWTWSPGTGLDTTGGNTVQAFPSDTTLYTITGTPINPCFTSNLTAEIVVIPTPGPEISMTPPGTHCISYDLNDLIFSDINGVPGTSVIFLSEEPTSAADSVNVFTGTTVYPGDSVYLFISQPGGCYDYQFVNINWSNGFTYDANIINPVCLDSNGTIEIINIVGASGPLTFDWTPAAPNTALNDSIPAGTYAVTITDSAGCSVDTVINFPNVTTLTSSITIDQFAECGMPTGQITVTPGAGSTAPFTFDIGTGPQTSGTFTGLTDSLYVVEITDGAGCLIFDSIIVPDTSTIAISFVSMNPEQCGDGSGTLTVAGSGGGTPYNFDIGGALQTSPTFGSLGAGTYTVVVTDLGGCQDSVDVTVTDTATMTSSLVDTLSATCGTANGEATILAINGGTGYTYTVGSTSNSTGIFTGLAPGSYTATITSGTCTNNVNFTIADVDNLVSTLVDTNEAICAVLGSVDVTSTGGAATISYSIPGFPSQPTGSFTGIAAGAYTMTITSGTCTENVPFTINFNPGDLDLSLVSATDENCGVLNGVIESSATGGTTPYTYTIGAGTQPIGTFGGLNNGAYVVTASDVNGCVDTINVTLGEIPISINLGPDIIACNSYTIQGTGVGAYLWSTGETSTSITVVDSGVYVLEVTTPSCYDSDTIVISILPDPTLHVPNVFTPNGDGSNDKFEVWAMFVDTYHISIFDRWGILVFTSDSINSMWDGKKDGSEVAEGTYMYVIEYVNPCEDPEQQVRTGTLQLFR